MKKFDWKKVVILLIALVLCFSMAACTPEPEPEKKAPPIEAKVFLDKLFSGLNGVIGALGDQTSKTRHLDVTLVANVKQGTKGLANLKIRIAGNFEETIGNNEVLLEVRDGEVLKLGLYEKAGKIYFEEALTTAASQKLSIEGVAAINIQSLFAKLPGLLQTGLKGFDMSSITGMIGSVSGVLDDFLDIQKTTNAGLDRYSARLVVNQEEGKGGLGAIMGILAPILKGVPGITDIINTILPSVLGIKFNAAGTGIEVSVPGQTSFPNVNILVDLDANSKFNGLSFGYKWPKSGNIGNDLELEVGLQNIVIDTVSTLNIAAIDVAQFKPGALKVSAKIDIPTLTAAGFVLNADFYVQPGFGSIANDAATENSMIKVRLTATDKNGKTFPLAAEYKYIDVVEGGTTDDQKIDKWDEATKNFIRVPYAGTSTTDTAEKIRVGRLYFDIGGLLGLQNVTGPSKFFKEIDIADLLIGATNPTQKSTATPVVVDGISFTAHYKATKSAAYYAKYKTFGYKDFLWTGMDMKKGTVGVGTHTATRYTPDARIDTVIVDGKVYEVTVTFANLIAAMTAGEGELTGNLTIAVAAAATQPIPESTQNFYKFDVYNGDKIIKTLRVDSAATEAGAKAEAIVTITEAAIAQLNADPAVKAYLPQGTVADIKVIYQTGASAYTVKTPAEIDALTAGVADTTESWIAKSNKGVISATAGNIYTMQLILVCKNDIKKALTVQSEIDAAYDAFVKAAVSADGLRTGADVAVYPYLKRWNNGYDAAVPAISTDIETNYGSDFSFAIGKLGGLINLALGKVGNMMDTSVIEVNLTDADSILSMGAYLNTHKMFASQIRMLLSNEKQSAEYKKYSISSPYIAVDVPTEKGNAVPTGTIAVVQNSVVAYNSYMAAEILQNLWASVFGATGFVTPTDWTVAQTEAYTKAATKIAKAQAYAANEKAIYITRRDANNKEYQKAVPAFEKKALDFIRGYIDNGATKILDKVTTMEELLYGADGKSGISFRASFNAASVIPGLPLSFKVEVLRGGVVLATAQAGAQFVEAGAIPTTPALDWTGAISIHEVESVDTGNGVMKNFSKVLMQLLRVHAGFTGLTVADLV